MVHNRGSQSRLELIREKGGDPVRSWSGVLAWHILEAGILPKGCCKTGCYALDKTLSWHLILAAAAAECMWEQVAEKGLAGEVVLESRPSLARA